MWFNLFPYKIQCHQVITNIALGPRKILTNEFHQMIDKNKIDVGCIWFTDLSRLHLERIVNYKTAEEETLKTRLCVLQKLRLGLYCSFKGFVGPFLRRKGLIHADLQHFDAPFWVSYHVLENSWFMQQWALPHTTAAVFEFLDEYFWEQV